MGRAVVKEREVTIERRLCCKRHASAGKGAVQRHGATAPRRAVAAACAFSALFARVRQRSARRLLCRERHAGSRRARRRFSRRRRCRAPP